MSIEAKNARLFIGDTEIMSSGDRPWFRVPRSYEAIDCTHLAPVQICDSCGCLHRFMLGHTCESCWQAITRVKIERTKERLRVTGEALARAFRSVGGVLGDSEFHHMAEVGQARRFVVMPGSNMGKTGGDFTRGQIEDALRPLGWISIAPDLGDFARSLAEQVALRLDIPVDVLLQPLPPTGFSLEKRISEIYGGWPEPYQRSDEPVMQRNRRNKGPAPVDKWWDKRGY